MPPTAEVFCGEAEAVSTHELASDPDVALRDIDVSARLAVFHRVLEHAAAAEDLDLELGRPAVRIFELPHEHLHHLVGVTAVERRFLLAMRETVREHVMAHPGDKPRGMPERDRHARAEEGADPRLALAEVELTRPEKNLENVVRRVHQRRR